MSDSLFAKLVFEYVSSIILFKPRHTLVAGHYVFTLTVPVSVRPSVHPSVVRTSVRTSFPFDNLSIYERISFKFLHMHMNQQSPLGL